MTALDAPAEPLFEESLRADRRAWIWLPVIVLITFFTVAPIFAPLGALSWLVNVARYRRARVRIDPDYLWVGRRWVRLCALELPTLGRAGNTWPWRVLNTRYLGANPLWTRDSVGLRGIDGGKPYWVSIGTNRREELVGVLGRAVPPARARAEASGTWSPMATRLPPSDWYPDPWDPVGHLRFWDGAGWTGWTHPVKVDPDAGDRP